MRRSTIVLLAATSALLPATVARASGRISCRPATVPVAQLTTATFVHGELCRPAGSASADVLVLVPEATYAGTYWDVAYRPTTYNFRLAANKADYATFVLDRLGTGRSSAPPSLVVTHQWYERRGVPARRGFVLPSLGGLPRLGPAPRRARH